MEEHTAAAGVPIETRKNLGSSNIVQLDATSISIMDDASTDPMISHLREIQSTINQHSIVLQELQESSIKMKLSLNQIYQMMITIHKDIQIISNNVLFMMSTMTPTRANETRQNIQAPEETQVLRFSTVSCLGTSYIRCTHIQ